MNQDIQNQLDKQINARRVAEVVDSSNAPILASELLKKDKRETDIVEVNIRNQTAWVVDSSNAPELTPTILAEKGKRLWTVEVVYDRQVVQVRVRHGKPLQVDIAYAKILENYQDTPLDTARTRERDRAIKHLLLSSMIETPQFSYQGEGEGHPIEECSPILLNALYEAYAAVNAPTEDAIYQVEVLRSTPLDAMLLFQQTFELYPAPQTKKIMEMPDADIQALLANRTAQHQVAVASMITTPAFSYNGSGKDGAYPVEDISIAMLETLFEAYRVVNIPEAGVQALNRFPQMGDTNRNRTDTGSEPLDNQ